MRILLSLVALGLALYPLSASGSQTDDINRGHNSGRHSRLESDEQVERRPNAYLLIEGLDHTEDDGLQQAPLANPADARLAAVRGIISRDDALLIAPKLHDWQSIFKEAEGECDRLGKIPGYCRLGALPWIRLESGRFLCEFPNPVNGITSVSK